jgi:hypothetical protein
MKTALYHFLALAFFMAPPASADSNPLKPLRWDYRIVLIAAPSTEAERLVSELNQVKEAINERHIVWFVIDEENLATNYARPLGKSFRPAVMKYFFGDFPEKIQVRLIGKDGGVKSKAEKLELEELFGLIDSMPMRQAEMKRN